MPLLTATHRAVHSVCAVSDASETGRDNPMNTGAKRQSCRFGRFFHARNPSMAGWARHAQAWPGSCIPVCHPRSARRPIPRDNGTATAPIPNTGAFP